VSKTEEKMRKIRLLPIFIAVLIGGLTGRQTNAPAVEPAHEEAEHEHHAPHQGTLVVFGDEFAHVELVLDPETGTLNAYALDGEAENALYLEQATIDISIQLPQDQDFTLPLTALENPLTGESVGNSSEFSAQSDSLKGLTNFKGNIIWIKIKGAEFENTTFSFPEGNE
jgi:hypothetical protein